MKRHVIRIRNGAQVKEHVLEGTEAVLGRSEKADIKVDSKAVSSRHLRIRVADEKVIVRDLGSTFGTFPKRTPICPRAWSFSSAT
jgi:pSer/pThr/pTyr-binding forkhead associated (FHA) protein